jgi:hypothetical protein
MCVLIGVKSLMLLPLANEHVHWYVCMCVRVYDGYGACVCVFFADEDPSVAHLGAVVPDWCGACTSVCFVCF